MSDTTQDREEWLQELRQILDAGGPFLAAFVAGEAAKRLLKPHVEAGHVDLNMVTSLLDAGPPSELKTVFLAAWKSLAFAAWKQETEPPLGRP